MAKRSYTNAFSEDEMLGIKLAEEGREPLQAQLLVLLPMSQCVRSLPDKTEWDLSSLLIDGQPVTRSTVVAWLNCAYKHILDCDFEAQEVEQSAASLYQLLVFADAVGSQRVLMKACVAAHAENTRFVLELRQQELQLDINGLYFFGSAEEPNPLILFGRCSARSTGACTVGEAASLEERSAFMSQLAAQVEGLLYMAYKLQLDQLLLKVTKFIQSSMIFGLGSPLLWDFKDTIFSKRVMDAAAGSPEGRTALLDHFTKVPCSFEERGSMKQLLKPVDLPADAKQPLKFAAVLMEGLLGVPAGSMVQVKLDLFGKSSLELIGVGTVDVHLSLAPQ
jgi:hypothetical protein